MQCYVSIAAEALYGCVISVINDTVYHLDFRDSSLFHSLYYNNCMKNGSVWEQSINM